MDQSVELAKKLGPMGVDLIDCSSGGLDPRAKIPLGPNYQVPFAQKIRDRAGIRTGAVGLIPVLESANLVIQEEKADVVMFAREFLRRPYWPLEVARERGVIVPWAAQYLRAGPDGSPAR